jgi:5-bromo-4-chloroindolyl phosphate hydrolysis protein
MKTKKNHIAGIFLLILVLPTITIFPVFVNNDGVVMLAMLEAMLGIRLLFLKDDRMPKKKFYGYLGLYILVGIIVVVIAATFPYWILYVMGWR